jgi:hypothetical protein
MAETDRFLLDSVGGPPAARVVVIPTASALELGMPERWNTMGVAHFHALGVQVSPIMLLTRDDAHDEQVLADLRGADLYYFSGGNPEHVIEMLRGTPAWEIIRAGYAAGAVLYECLTGKGPHDDLTLHQVFARSVNDAPALDPAALRPDLPAAMAAVVRGALAPRPDRRFASASEMLAALEAVSVRGTAATRSPSLAASAT